MLFSKLMLTLAGRNITVFPVDPVLEICDVTPRPNISVWVPEEERQTVKITATETTHYLSSSSTTRFISPLREVVCYNISY